MLEYVLPALLRVAASVRAASGGRTSGMVAVHLNNMMERTGNREDGTRHGFSLQIFCAACILAVCSELQVPLVSQSCPRYDRVC